MGRIDDVDQAPNWCDRWCERCALVTRCPIGMLEGRRSRDTPGQLMADTAELIDCASTVLQVELARAGIAMGDDEVDAYRAEVAAARAHPLHQEAEAWMRLASCWLPDKSGEAAEVVGWYWVLVPSKVQRALLSLTERDPDAQGTAKVVTLALHRVIDAVTDWCAAHPLDRSGAKVVAASGDLIASIEATFPGHMSFRRPGFDP